MIVLQMSPSDPFPVMQRQKDTELDIFNEEILDEADEIPRGHGIAPRKSYFSDYKKI